MAKKVVTFGEIMLRLAPEGYYRFVQGRIPVWSYSVVGGEANVAIFSKLWYGCKLCNKITGS